MFFYRLQSINPVANLIKYLKIEIQRFFYKGVATVVLILISSHHSYKNLMLGGTKTIHSDFWDSNKTGYGNQ